MTVEKKANNLNIYQKIVEVRRSIQHLTKDAQSHHHRYISGDALLSAIRPKMDELGIVLLTRVIEHTRENMIVDMTIEYDFINSDHPEDRFVVPWYASGRQNDPSQSIGSAMTYSERYVLKKTFLVPTDEDDPDAKPQGNGNGKQKPQQQQQSHSQPPKSIGNTIPGYDKSSTDDNALDKDGKKTLRDYKNDLTVLPMFIAKEKDVDNICGPDGLKVDAEEIYKLAAPFTPYLKPNSNQLKLGRAIAIYIKLRDMIHTDLHLQTSDAYNWWNNLDKEYIDSYIWWKVREDMPF